MKLAKPLLITAAVIVLAAALTYALLHKPLAPAVTFTNLQGETFELDDLRGKVVLVNFWATSCGACVAEMPDMIEVYREYHDRGFEIVAVAMGYDPPNHVLSFAQTRQLPFPVALDVNGDHARAFGNVRATPTAFVISRDGKVLEHKLGVLDFARLRTLLDKELPCCGR